MTNYPPSEPGWVEFSGGEWRYCVKKATGDSTGSLPKFYWDFDLFYVPKVRQMCVWSDKSANWLDVDIPPELTDKEAMDYAEVVYRMGNN